jgi:hypothetical protein
MNNRRGDLFSGTPRYTVRIVLIVVLAVVLTFLVTP